MKDSKKQKHRTKTYKKQKGGNLCKGDISEYEYDETQLLGEGQFGRVYGVKNNPNLAVKVQEIPLNLELTGWFAFLGEEDHTWRLQNELAIATKAGEMGIGPRIYHLAICKADKPDDMGYIYQKIIWVMDRIQNGDTVYNILQKYKKDLKRQGKSKDEIKRLDVEKRQEFVSMLNEHLQKLEEKDIEVHDIHGGNLMYGSIQGGEPKLYIIDYGEFSFREQPRRAPHGTKA